MQHGTIVYTTFMASVQSGNGSAGKVMKVRS